MRKPAQERKGLTGCSETRKGPFSVSPVWTSSGPGKEPAAAMMGLAEPGGVTREAPGAGPAPLPPSSPPLRGPRPQLTPDTHALSTSSRTFHMFNIVPRAGRAAASLPYSPRTPGHFRAGADPGRGRCHRPPPRTPPVRSFPCHSRGAAGDTSRRGGRGAAWSGSARLSARCSRGTPGLVVLCGHSGPVKLSLLVW